MKTPKTFSALIKRAEVADISYEPENSWVEDGKETGSIYWVYLRAGWGNGDGGHLFTGSTISDVKSDLSAVVKCHCDQCKNGEGY